MADLTNSVEHRTVALVEQRRAHLAVTVHAEDELGQVVGAYGDTGRTEAGVVRETTDGTSAITQGWNDRPGSRPASTYAAIHRQRRLAFSGIKLFYRQDTVLLSPEQVMGLDPVPAVVVYQ